MEGLDSTVPVSGYMPPTIDTVTIPDGFASTQGGSVIVIDGHNFGSIDSSVRLSVLAGVSDDSLLFADIIAPAVTPERLVAYNCTLTIPHTQVRCALPVGTGVIVSATLQVFDQGSVLRSLSTCLSA